MPTHDTILKHFGKRVREMRLSKGLSQEGLGALADLDRTYISSLERGKRNVCLKSITAIASALEVPLFTLFQGIETTNTDTN